MDENQNNNISPKKVVSKKWWIWLTLTIVGIIVFVSVINWATGSDDDSTYSPQTQTEQSSGTTGEKNALRSAKTYLLSMSFSYDGLVEQLEYEGYSFSEATYGVSHCGANWNEQAAKCAKTYLKTMPFSRQGLIDQLEYEGFTHSQAVYGAEANGY